jgi:hypothetical protein
MSTIEEIDNVIKDRRSAELKRLADQKENVDPGFNLFALVSNLYYRENFHSDIIRAILDVHGKHGAGNKYLLKLIELLNKSSLENKIDPSYYTDAVEVVREVGRRDITITGLSNHCIIIENKIYDANDTWNQIPKYVKQLEDEGKIVDAVVYLILNQGKRPDERTWQLDGDKKKEIRRKLAPIKAYDGLENDLCNGWLQECIKETSDIDSLSILRQYLKIIKYLTRNHMDHKFLHTLDTYLKEDPQRAKVFISINNNLKDYPKFILLNINQYFKLDDRVKPFESINRYTDNLYFLFNYRIAGCTFNTDIIIENIDSCIIDFSVREDYAYQKEHPEVVLDTIGMLNQFEWNGRRFVHRIEGSFIEFEKKVTEFITDFLNSLKQNENEIEEKLANIITKSNAATVTQTFD